MSDQPADEITRLDDSPDQPCRIDGCNGIFGAGCTAEPASPLYDKCKHNRIFWARVWNSTPTRPPGDPLP